MKQPIQNNRSQSVPMLRLLVPFAAGIVLAEYFALPVWLLAAAFILSGIIALLLRSQAAVLALLVTAGFASVQLRQSESTLPYNLYTVYEVVVEDIPSVRTGYSSSEGRITSWRDASGATWNPSAERIMIFADSLTQLEAGERIRFRGRVQPFGDKNESYRRLMLRRGFAGTVWLSERTIIERLPARYNNLHFSAVEHLQRLPVSGDAAAICRAMTAGDRSGITADLRMAYSRSGLSHIMAVSGLHTGLVFVLINLLLWWMPLLRRGHIARNIIAAAAIWLFVAAAGFPPSAVRAAVMCTMLQFALASASEYTALNALSAAAFGMLLYNPAWFGDISFQLSFVAVAAIFLWGVPLCRRIKTRYKILNYVLDTFFISLVSTIATAPLVSHTFGIVSLSGLLANPVAIPLSGIVIFAGVIWIIAPVGFLSPAFGFVIEATSDFINATARFAASIPYGTIDYTLSTWVTIAIYVFFAAVTIAARTVKPKKRVYLPK